MSGPFSDYARARDAEREREQRERMTELLVEILAELRRISAKMESKP